MEGFVDNERAPTAAAFRHPIAFELSVGLNGVYLGLGQFGWPNPVPWAAGSPGVQVDDQGPGLSGLV